jgi:hypothetical protein
MSKSIESRIITLITERLEDALINEAQLFVPVGSDNKSSLSAKAVLSGTYNGTHPRKFEIEVKDASTLHITETTLWANLFTNHAAPVNADVAFATSLLNVTEAANEVGINVITNRKHSAATIFSG